MASASAPPNDVDTRRKPNVKDSSSSSLSKQLMECKLCLSVYSADFFYKLDLCGCAACEQCMTDYVEAMLNQGRVLQIPCPINRCAGAYMTVEEVRRFLDDADYARFQDIKYLREVEVDPSITFCPRPGCENVCPIVSRQSAEYERKINSRSPLPVEAWQTRRVATAIRCSRCHFEFCSVCKTRWHAKFTCEEANARLKPEERSILFCTSKQSERGDLIQKLASAGNPNVVDSTLPKFIDIENEDSEDEDEISTKPCPVCALPIERDFGCAKITCVRCNHVFCWHCLQLIDEDFLWLHYETGACKDKLGIPRVQIHTYRLTAILTMAGIGLLILIASPVIVIAAPCLLYMKFGPKSNEDDDTDLDTGVNWKIGSDEKSAKNATENEASNEQSDLHDQIEQRPSTSASTSTRPQDREAACRKKNDFIIPFCRIL